MASLTGDLLATKGSARPAETHPGEAEAVPEAEPAPRRRAAPFLALFLAGAALPVLLFAGWLSLQERSAPSDSPVQSAAAPAAETPQAPDKRAADQVAASGEDIAALPARLGPLDPIGAVGASAARLPADSPPAEPAASVEPDSNIAAAPVTEAPPPAPPVADSAPAQAEVETPSVVEPPPAPTQAAAPESPPPQTADAGDESLPVSSAPPPRSRPKKLAALTAIGGAGGGPSYFVQLSSVGSHAAATREIARLKRALTGVLNDAPLGVQDGRIRDGQKVFRIRAGPMENRQAANRLCRAVKAKQRGCLVVRIDG